MSLYSKCLANVRKEDRRSMENTRERLEMRDCGWDG